MSARETRSANPPSLSPHPDLPEYYAGSDKKRGFVREIFNHTAPDYDRVERMMALGSGPWYRRRAPTRAGLTAGLDVLDVAMGTGLVAREAVALAGDPSLVTGLDPSIGMVSEARRRLPIRIILARGEQLPVRNDSFDFLSMGYALRHVSDIDALFSEYLRALRPGGTVCVLEISRPQGRLALLALRLYMKGIVPLLTRLMTRHRETARLMEYYWDTIAACVPPETILAAMTRAGFKDVRRHTELGIFSEYVGNKPR
ncbi:MAG: class I SAM-dependent methyltransferase [Comamonadaceae bacterium]|nr:class I SAM-dependent methyltransferase [Comamonadaceae bacterium]